MLPLEVFTPEQCAELVAAFDASEQKNDESNLPNDPYYRNSFGVYQLPAALKHAQHVTDIVAKVHPNIKFDSTYMRSYHNDSYLLVHTDRPGLDLTISICLENDKGYLWDLKVSNLPWEGGEWDNNIDHSKWQGTYSTAHLGIGQGGLCQGRKYPHWRDTLVCPPGDRLVYVFYHWAFTEPVIERAPAFTREELAMDVLARLLVDTSFAVADKLLDRANHG
jgi:hypothetical protein